MIRRKRNTVSSFSLFTPFFWKTPIFFPSVSMCLFLYPFLLDSIFTIAPEAYGLFQFRGNPKDGISEETYKSEKFLKHARGVIGMVDTAVDLLEKDDMATLSEALQKLGARHVGYKVEFVHYPIVGQALLQTLEAALADGWSDELKEAWTGVFGVITEHMQTGAKAKLAEAK
eukprot:Plantae.Rhodophyta-Palmaria_palmata.ctg12044.p1 GENE.Plantae.Rhodophyta-Palmaria_palmata.ctg12044~~Plantae.Rhodophyta-Palmaria_palmata.ctg12044.p1  ORF type:complete len:172 (-),score=28.34 Plantae.Rhodophyta-Palmaria_palmata.ctg12044:103-618(-)